VLGRSGDPGGSLTSQQASVTLTLASVPFERTAEADAEHEGGEGSSFNDYNDDKGQRQRQRRHSPKFGRVVADGDSFNMYRNGLAMSFEGNHIISPPTDQLQKPGTREAIRDGKPRAALDESGRPEPYARQMTFETNRSRKSGRSEPRVHELNEEI